MWTRSLALVDTVRVYEVFLAHARSGEMRHAGSLEAADDETALVLARECYVRRAEGETMWLVDRRHLIEGDRDYIAPNKDKPHRHSDGQLVAEHRRRLRALATRRTKR